MAFFSSFLFATLEAIVHFYNLAAVQRPLRHNFFPKARLELNQLELGTREKMVQKSIYIKCSYQRA